MDSSNLPVQDKFKTVNDEGGAETSPNSEAERSTLVNDEKQKHRERVFQGMIDSSMLAVIKGEKTLDEVDNAVKDEVAEKLQALNLTSLAKKSEPNTSNVDVIAQKVQENISLTTLLSSLDGNDKVEAKADYETFRNQGKTPEEAAAKVKKLYGIKSREEYVATGQRAHKVAGGSFEEPKGKLKNLNAKESGFAQAFGLTE